MDVTHQLSALSKGKRLLSVLPRDSVLTVLVLAILGLALGLRLYGLDWDQGYPYTPHPDERAILLKVDELSPPTLGRLGQLLDADESSWNPRWFNYGSFPYTSSKGFSSSTPWDPATGSPI